MPTYDYICPNGHRFEVIHSLSVDGPTVCPICGAAPVRKAFSAPTIHFKGSGWAKKDRSTASRKAAKADSVTSESSSGGSDGSTTTSGSDAGGEGSSSSDGATAAKPAVDSAPAKDKPKSGDASAAGGSAAAD
jgi:putative FmdB family regulatory protein